MIYDFEVNLVKDHYKKTDVKKFIKEHCGTIIGKGATRRVYEFKHDPGNFVVKIAKLDYIESNMIECRVWQEVRWVDHLAKWLAPVEWTTRDYQILIQRRVDFSKPRDQYPDRVPHFFMDLAYENYGWIGDQFVCADYGSSVFTNGFTRRMVRAEWHSQKDFTIL